MWKQSTFSTTQPVCIALWWSDCNLLLSRCLAAVIEIWLMWKPLLCLSSLPLESLDMGLFFFFANNLKPTFPTHLMSSTFVKTKKNTLLLATQVLSPYGRPSLDPLLRKKKNSLRREAVGSDDRDQLDVIPLVFQVLLSALVVEVVPGRDNMNRHRDQACQCNQILSGVGEAGQTEM